MDDRDQAQSAPPACSVYVYYRLRDGAPPVATRAVADLQGRIAMRLGVRGRLLVKRGEPLLWMEIYDDVTDADRLLDALSEEAARARFERLLQPGKLRTVEVFIPAACA